MRLAALPGRPLELDADGGHQPAVVVGDDQVDARQAATLEPGEEGHPAALRFAVAQVQAADLAVALPIHADGDEGAHRPYPATLAHLHDQRVGQHEGIHLTAQIPFVPGRHQRVQAFAPVGDRRRGEARPAELLGDAGDLARRDAVDHQLHERQNKRLLAALGAREEFGGEGAIAHLGHAQQEASHPRRQPMRLSAIGAIAVALPLRSPLIRRGLQLLGDLRLEHLIHHGLQELPHLVLTTEQPLNSRCKVCGSSVTWYWAMGSPL
jgi:hypothetical protein